MEVSWQKQVDNWKAFIFTLLLAKLFLFVVVTEEPYCFSLVIASAEADNKEEDLDLDVSLQFTFTPDYPDEAPLFEVQSANGFSDDCHIDKISTLIEEQVCFYYKIWL